MNYIFKEQVVYTYHRILASQRGTHAVSMTVFLALILVVACKAHALTFIEAHFSEQGIPSLGETRAGGDVSVSPDGRHVYFYGGHFSYRVSGQFYPAAGGIGVFSRDADTGELTFVDAIVQGIDVDYLAAVGKIDISPDGRHVYVPAGFDRGSRDLLVYQRDEHTGKLTLVEQVARRGGLEAAVSQDGRHVYVLSGFLRYEVLIFSRNKNDGTVQFVDAIPAQIKSLDGPQRLIVSQDGRHVYVLIFEGRIITLVRDQVTGTLEQSQVISLDTNLTSIVASRDGRHIYAGENYSRGYIFALARDASTGRLELVGQTRTQKSSSDLAISPDGSEFYESNGGGVEVFVRDSVTGTLTSAQIFSEGVDGVVGIWYTGGLDVSPDGQNVYVIGSSRDDPASLAVFQRADAPTPPGKAKLISPSGEITEDTPTYTWNAVANSTWYYLWVDDSTGTMIKKWYTAEQADCGNGTGVCSVTPTTELSDGACKWWIQTWNDYGYGPWSAGMSFTVDTGAVE